MSEIITVGLDVAKNALQVHGRDGAGGGSAQEVAASAAAGIFRQVPSCVVALEACGGAHHWGREIGRLGHDARLIPPAHAKPFVKRQKNDAAGAEAISEAALRPTTRFVPVKSRETQAAAMDFRVRKLLIRYTAPPVERAAPRASRGAEHRRSWRCAAIRVGQIAPHRASHAARLIAIAEDPEGALPADAIPR